MKAMGGAKINRRHNISATKYDGVTLAYEDIRIEKL
jgi:hypothetical protein